MSTGDPVNAQSATKPTPEAPTQNPKLAGICKFWPIFIGTLIVLGGHYLRSYLSSMNVPFPMELNVLATSLLLMGIASVLLILSLISLLLFTAIIRMVPMEWNYNELVLGTHIKNEGQESSPKGSKSFITKKRALATLTLGYLVFFPIVSLLIIFFLKTEDYLNLPGVTAATLLVGFISLMSLAFSFLKKSPKSSFIIKFGFCFFVQISVAVAWTFPTAIFVQTGIISTNTEMAILIAILTLLYMVGLIPSDDSEQLKSDTAGAFIRSTILRNPFPFLAFFLLAILTILPPAANHIGKGALRFFEVGGGLPHKLSLSDDLRKDLSGLGLTLEDEQRSIPAFLIFKVNEISYYEIRNFIIPINTKNLVVNLAPDPE